MTNQIDCPAKGVWSWRCGLPVLRALWRLTLGVSSMDSRSYQTFTASPAQFGGSHMNKSAWK